MLDMTKSYVVGVDIGGTNTVFGIVDARGTIVATNSLKTQEYGDNAEKFVDHLADKISLLIEENNLRDSVRSVGIGAPNGNYYTGTIDFATNMAWKKSLPIVTMLSERLNLPTILTNDAKAAAIGEMTYGVAKGLKDFIMITLGTGVGSGIVVNEKVLYGTDSLAGELGHFIVRRNGRKCGCGRNGCLETYCSASGIVRSAHEFLDARTEPSLLRSIDRDKLTSKDIYEAASRGDAIAIDIFNFTGKILGETLADFVTFSSPEAFVLFGGLAAAGDLLMNPVKEAFQTNLLKVYNPPKLLFSSLPAADSAVLGAAAIAWEAKSEK